MRIYGTCVLTDGREFDLDGDVVVNVNTNEEITVDQLIELGHEIGVDNIIGSSDLDDDECNWAVISKDERVVLNSVDEVNEWLTW